MKYKEVINMYKLMKPISFTVEKAQGTAEVAD